MAKGYQFKCDYGDGCGMKEYKSHEHLGADYILATDYAAIEAERDEWRRRLDRVMEQFGEIICDPSCGITWTCSRCQASADALAIAEGRDDG